MLWMKPPTEGASNDLPLLSSLFSAWEDLLLSARQCLDTEQVCQRIFFKETFKIVLLLHSKKLFTAPVLWNLWLWIFLCPLLKKDHYYHQNTLQHPTVVLMTQFLMLVDSANKQFWIFAVINNNGKFLIARVFMGISLKCQGYLLLFMADRYEFRVTRVPHDLAHL